jgi:uncharacterized delta-60 repeat protein
LLLLAVVASLFVIPAGTGGAAKLPAAGQLDRTFSGDGLAQTANHGKPSGIAGAPGGKIVQGSSAAVLRYTAAGRLDRTFGGDGAASTHFGGRHFTTRDVLVDRTGRVVVLGSVNGKANHYKDWMGVGRLTESGRVDRSFAGNGLSLKKFGYSVAPGELAFYPGGRILAVGWSRSKGGFVARYRADGHLDRTFSNDGILRLKPDQGFGGLGSVAVDRSGRIVLGVRYAQRVGTRFGRGQMGLVRLLSNGRFDRSFSRDGIASFKVPSVSRATTSDLTIDRRGRIVAIASYDGSSVVRVSPSGNLDRSFAKNGVNGPNWSFHAFSISVDDKGRVLVLGYDQPPDGAGTRTPVEIDRLKSNGRNDPRFGFNVRYYNDFRLGPIEDHFVDSRGRIVAGGQGRKGPSVIRVLNP